MRATTTDGNVTIAVEGHLDVHAGETLVDAVVHALREQPLRVDIDLSVLTSFTNDGALALARCRDLCAAVPGGLHYRTEGGAGQLAVLSAFERDAEVDTLG